jgi:hypothetical protein
VGDVGQLLVVRSRLEERFYLEYPGILILGIQRQVLLEGLDRFAGSKPVRLRFTSRIVDAEVGIAQVQMEVGAVRLQSQCLQVFLDGTAVIGRQLEGVSLAGQLPGLDGVYQAATGDRQDQASDSEPECEFIGMQGCSTPVETVF